MRKIIAFAFAGLLSGWVIFGCGHDAGFDAIILNISGDTSNFGTVGPGSGPYGVVSGIGFKVQKSDSDTSPAHDINVSVMIGGLNTANAVFYLNPDQTKPAGGTDYADLRTDENGAIRVYPSFTVSDCDGTNPSGGNISGSVSLTAVISADQTSWTGNFTVDCP